MDGLTNKLLFKERRGECSSWDNICVKSFTNLNMCEIIVGT